MYCHSPEEAVGCSENLEYIVEKLGYFRQSFQIVILEKQSIHKYILLLSYIIIIILNYG